MRDLVTANPRLLHEEVLIRKGSNWGLRLTCAANLGRDRFIQVLHSLGAKDLQPALARAVLQGRIATAKMLHTMLGHPSPPDGALAGPAYTLSVEGTAFALDVFARAYDENGKLLAPVDVVVETESRKLHWFEQ